MSLAIQKELVVKLKKETVANIKKLGRIYAMPSDLTKQVSLENALEKPTQNVFNNVAHYLVCIIDPQVGSSLPWPLYDTEAERTYRSKLSSFVADYSLKGLLSPVMSSYLVNPGCYKVTVLIFQLSQLAVQRVLESKMKKDSQKNVYNEVTQKYKTGNKEFLEGIEKHTSYIMNKFSNYVHKRQVMERAAEMLYNKTIVLEESVCKAQAYIDNLLDNYVKKHKLDKETKQQILEIKDVYKRPEIFEKWLSDLDVSLDKLETEWNTKTTPFLNTCQTTARNTETLIARQTGEADKKTFTLEYNPKTDEINTHDLQKQVSTQQKYILKNIVKGDRLNFPNLIRGYLIAICYIWKDVEIEDDICKFNEYLEEGKQGYGDIISSMRSLLGRIHNAEKKLEYEPKVSYHHVDVPKIPPFPDLSNLKMTQEFHFQKHYDAFTPINRTKYQFNLRKQRVPTFTKPLPKITVTPIQHGLRQDNMRSIISCRISSYDHMTVPQNLNLSVMSQTSNLNRGNETIAECATGFTKQQLVRLLSTKKSSSKKHKRIEKPNGKFKKGSLFNETMLSTFTEESVLFRSHSSPNLFENKKKSLKDQSRKLSVVQAQCPSILEVSGIAALGDSNKSTPQRDVSLENSSVSSVRSALSMPSITPTTQPVENSDLNKEINISTTPRNDSEVSNNAKSESIVQNLTPVALCTPASKIPVRVTKKTNSLEKIINRFKKVRASVAFDSSLLSKHSRASDEFKTIDEEKENSNTVNSIEALTVNRNLLPDLLSPSFNTISPKSSTFLEQLGFDTDFEKPSRPRESLGTALGVDNTFLDQFDLTDD